MEKKSLRSGETAVLEPMNDKNVKPKLKESAREIESLEEEIKKKLEKCLLGLTIEKEFELQKIVNNLAWKKKNLDASVLKKEYQMIFDNLSSFDCPIEKELKNDLPTQTVFEYCLYSSLNRSRKRENYYKFLVVLYLAFDFGLKPEHLTSFKRSDLLAIENEQEFLLDNKPLFVTSRAKKNFLLVREAINGEFFTTESLLGLQPETIARNSNQILKKLSANWNQSWSLNNFRFSFVRHVLLENINNFEVVSAHYDVSKARVDQLLTKQFYFTGNIIQKKEMFPYLEWTDV